MNKMTYTEFIQNHLEKIPNGTPVFVRDIAKQLEIQFALKEKEAKAATTVAMKRMYDKKTIPGLRFYQKGIYYFAAQTIFGETGINKEQLIAAKYLLPDIGYETGPAFMQKLGLTTLLPRERQYATNKAKDGIRKDTALGIIIKPGKTTITAGNKMYLQLLDILNALDETPIDIDNPYKALDGFMKKHHLEYSYLLKLADQFYGKKTIIEIARMASKGDEE